MLAGAATGNGAVSVAGGAWSKGFTVNTKTTQVVLTATDHSGRATTATVTLTLNLPIPQVTITWPLDDGFVTSRESFDIQFRVDQGLQQSQTKSLLEGENTVKVTGPENALGESDTATRRIILRKNVVFVKAGSVNGDGTSWSNAYGQIKEALATLTGKSGAYSVWVSAGEYQGFSLGRSETSIIGGFSATGNPAEVGARNLSQNVSRVRKLEESDGIFISGESPAICRQVILDGFRVFEESGQALAIRSAENVTIRNCWFENNRHEGGGAGLIAVSSGLTRFERVYIRDNFVLGYSSLYLNGYGQVELFDSEVTNNTLEMDIGGSAGILSVGGGPMGIRCAMWYGGGGGGGGV
jgi:hypothetical protein